jgi:hypothetical protein
MSTAPQLSSQDRPAWHFLRSARRLGNQLGNSWRRVPAHVPRLRVAHPLVTFAALIVLLPLGFLVYCIATLPFDGGLVVEPAPSALLVEADNGRLFASRGIFKGDKLAVQDVPADLARAVVAIEDRRFYEHRGIDLSALLRAAYRIQIAPPCDAFVAGMNPQRLGNRESRIINPGCWTNGHENRTAARQAQRR